MSEPMESTDGESRLEERYGTGGGVSGDKEVPPLKENDKIALVGNPNVGKSVIFGQFTGRYVVVSNYPGTTVEVTRGKAKLGDKSVEIVDTPGANSLLPMSDDERVTRDILLNEEISRAVLVADTKNLGRSLSIAVQLSEMGTPFVMALNMADEAASRGIEVDPALVKEKIGVDAYVTVATRRQGIDKLRKAVGKASRADIEVEYDEEIEEAVSKIEHLFEGRRLSARSLALMTLAADDSLIEWARDKLSDEDIEYIWEVHNELQGKYTQSISYVISQRRREVASYIEAEALRYTGHISPGIARRIGELMMHPLWGWAILMAVLVFTYEFVGRFGAGTLVDLLEGKVFEGYLNPALTKAVNFITPWPALGIVRDALVGEFGMLTVAITYAVAIILPIVTTFFIVFGILEDSGYLPRLAVMSNNFFRRMGLNGKAVLPMVLGLGCGTMAALTSRIMETRKERVLVILLLALGVPCSAQLGVILGILHNVGPLHTMIWVGTVVATLFTVGKIAERLIPGEGADFVMELPPVRVPQIANIIVKTLARIEWYLKEAVPLFILGTFLLFVLDRSGALTIIQNAARPIVVGWLNLPVEATQAFIVGFLRRDYGAAGLLSLAVAGKLDPTGVVVGMVTITLFVPCIANFFIIIKELGFKAAMLMAGFIFPFAFLVGGLVNLIMRWLNAGF